MCGNLNTVTLLKRSLARKSFKPVTIFHGPRGTGKSASALIAAKSLTCENPNQGVACELCSHCRANREAILKGVDSPYIKVVNLGRVSNTDEVNNLIHEVFEFQASSYNQVYVFEEVQALKYVKNAFTALLSEIDRMGPNTYIIMCTTALHDVKEDLRSRSIMFEFSQLNKTESKLYIKSLLQARGVSMSAEIVGILATYCKGVPRDIEKLIDFVLDNSVTIEEIKEYLQILDMSLFVEIFKSLTAGNTYEAIEMIKNTIAEKSVAAIVKSLKDFLIEVVFYLETNQSQEFSKSEKEDITRMFNEQTVLAKLIAQVEKLNAESSESDLMLFFIKAKMIVNKRPIVEIVSDNQATAIKENIQTVRLQSEMQRLEPKPVLTKLDAASLSAFSKGQ